jgi:endonuclease/exonuclease/phosphatase family metal-dependent hydrolase
MNRLSPATNRVAVTAYPQLTALRLLAVLPLAALFTGCTSVRETPPPPTVRVMSYNIQHGRGLDGKVNLERIAEVIRREGADIVALQEVDKGVARTDRRDLTAELASLTGMAGVFSNNFHFQGGEYGNAILTRFPVLSATNLHYRMLRPKEQRGLLQVTLDVQGRRLVVMNTHIDYRGDDSERLLNVGQIEEIVNGYGGLPVIVCGDFNDDPGSRVHQRMKERFDDAWEQAGQGSGFTFSADQPRKRIDYIWVRRGSDLEPVRAAVVASDASDHLPLTVEFRFR